jgi:hypothetical protein
VCIDLSLCALDVVASGIDDIIVQTNTLQRNFKNALKRYEGGALSKY